jgi:hypothetical protein
MSLSIKQRATRRLARKAHKKAMEAYRIARSGERTRKYKALQDAATAVLVAYNEADIEARNG